MGVHDAILESLRDKRSMAAKTSKTSKKSQVELKALIERRQISPTTINDSQAKRITYNNICYRLVSESKGTEKIAKNQQRNPAVILMNNGERYLGDAPDGVPHGFGTLFTVNGHIYDGEWKNGLHHGQGMYIWSDNTLFSGTWKNGERHGKGKYLIDGELYDCEYENGKLTMIDGCILENRNKWIPVRPIY